MSPGASYNPHMSVIAANQTNRPLWPDEVEQIIAQAAGRMAEAGKRVLAVIPDHTRTCPLPLVMGLLHKHLRPRVEKLDAIIALGTHPPLGDEQIRRLLTGRTGGGQSLIFADENGDSPLGDMRVFNHRWDDPSALATLGKLSAGAGARDFRRLV